MTSEEEDEECERGRKSKIRARPPVENHENYNFYYSTFCVMSTVRRTSGLCRGAQKKKLGSHDPPPPFTCTRRFTYAHLGILSKVFSRVFVSPLFKNMVNRIYLGRMT